MSTTLQVPDDIRPLLDAALAAEARSTQGEWIVRSMPGGEDCFVERPRQPGEAYGVEVMGEDYPNRAGDAAFIVAARRLVLALKEHTASRA